MGGLVLGGPYGCYHLTSIRCSICAHWVNQLLVKGGNQSSSSGWTFLLEGGYSQSMIIKSFKAIQGYPNILKGFRSLLPCLKHIAPGKRLEDGGSANCLKMLKIFSRPIFPASTFQSGCQLNAEGWWIDTFWGTILAPFASSRYNCSWIWNISCSSRFGLTFPDPIHQNIGVKKNGGVVANCYT